MTIITPDMTMTQIQNALNKAGDIRFKKGTYNITKTLYLQSDSNIECGENVIFKKKCTPSMFMTAVNEKTTKYNGVRNLRWFGGAFQSAITKNTQSNIITIVHAENVFIKGAQFWGDKAPHCIEINSSREVEIWGCHFKDHVPAKAYKEVIQIDFAHHAGLSYASAESKTYDGTHCRNIRITECIFEGEMHHAIGTHTVTSENKYHADITVDHCEYHGSGLEEGIFVKCLNMRNVRVVVNTVQNASAAVLVNALKTEYNPHGGTVKVEVPKKCKNVEVGGNEVTDSFDVRVV